jgi:uncharacterized membrane protein
VPAIIASAYLAAAVLFLGLDALWLGFVARRFYLDALGGLIRDRPNLGVALLFYAIHLTGIVVFAVIPALDQGAARAALLGALFGLCAYAAFDLTNLATLRGFPARLAFVDLAWGTVLTAVAALAGFYAARWASG